MGILLTDKEIATNWMASWDKQVNVEHPETATVRDKEEVVALRNLVLAQSRRDFEWGEERCTEHDHLFGSTPHRWCIECWQSFKEELGL